MYVYMCMYIYFFSDPWEFPGGLAGGTWHCHCSGLSSTPGCRTDIPQSMRPEKKSPQNNPLKQIVIHYRLLQDTEDNSVCSTACPCWLSVLYLVLCVCGSQTPNLSPSFSL